MKSGRRAGDQGHGYSIYDQYISEVARRVNGIQLYLMFVKESDKV